MSKVPPPAYTDDQRKTFELLQRIQMAWVALWSALGLFTAVLVAFLWAMFTDKNVVATGILGVTDGVLGFALTTVYTHLFPPPK